jgi:hypothetical protein
LTPCLPARSLPAVTQISVFVESNQGDEESTRVSKIGLAGWAGEVFNVAGARPAGGAAGGRRGPSKLSGATPCEQRRRARHGRARRELVLVATHHAAASAGEASSTPRPFLRPSPPPTEIKKQEEGA